MSHTLKFINRWDSKINSFCHCYKKKIEDIDTFLLEQYDKGMDLPFRKRSKPEAILNTYFPYRPSEKIRKPKDFLIFSGDPKRKDWLNIFTKSGQSASTLSSLLLVKINIQLFLKIKKGKPVFLAGSVLNIFQVKQSQKRLWKMLLCFTCSLLFFAVLLFVLVLNLFVFLHLLPYQRTNTVTLMFYMTLSWNINITNIDVPENASAIHNCSITRLHFPHFKTMYSFICSENTSSFLFPQSIERNHWLDKGKTMR